MQGQRALRSALRDSAVKSPYSNSGRICPPLQYILQMLNWLPICIRLDRQQGYCPAVAVVEERRVGVVSLLAEVVRIGHWGTIYAVSACNKATQRILTTP